MPKKQKTTNAPVERVLTIAGISLVILGCISAIYYAYLNQRFMNHGGPGIMYAYYLNYLILLGGGFAAGYWLTRKAKGATKLFSGVSYALLATIIFFVIDTLRFTALGFFGALPQPWELYIFNGAPLYALLITAVLAYFFQYRTKQAEFNVKAKWVFVVSFLAYHIYMLGNNIYYTLISTGESDIVTPLWVTIGSYLIQPLLVTVIAYFALLKVKTVFQRLFYAVFIGTIAYMLPIVLWNFQTDPFIDAVNVFQSFSIVIVLLATSLVILKSHTAAK